MSVETIIWIVASVLGALWLILFSLGVGVWVHVFLIAGILLIMFELLFQRRRSG